MSSSEQQDILGLAARRFVNQDFDGAVEALNTILSVTDSHLRLRVWALYISLADLSCDIKSKWGNQTVRESVANKVRSGEMWKQLSTCFGSIDQVPSPLMAKAVSVMAKHSTKLRMAADSVEQYMSLVGLETPSMTHTELNAYRALVKTFILQILTSDSLAEYDYARELVNNSKSLLKPDASAGILKDIDNKQQDFESRRKAMKDEVRRQQEELQRREQLRVDNAIAESRKIKPTQEQDPTSTELAVPGTSKVVPVSAPVSRTQSRTQSLTIYWKARIRAFVHSAGVKNAFIMILLILSVITNRAARRYLRFGGVWMLQALGQSAKMGLTVTYL